MAPSKMATGRSYTVPYARIQVWHNPSIDHIPEIMYLSSTIENQEETWCSLGWLVQIFEAVWGGL